MGYGYAETFLIVFLTHPGVIIDEAIVGLSPLPAAMWQVFWVWVLGLPGNGSPGLAWTAYAIYVAFLLAYLYFVGRYRIIK